ncbi:hypothetical protein JOC36_000914 [Weissella uvarum]|uniref:hypothetical protein n=1 Tax=Weissella uvarum TaxID=1479233 RepID=UPI00196198E7|nr:hypothetical protein [Weissella uvarum]MBM7617357.1 hypothetical protein [Weissella uvarum]MCM0595756.1 hypothetical protein [Weissella uvarum]
MDITNFLSNQNGFWITPVIASVLTYFFSTKHNDRINEQNRIADKKEAERVRLLDKEEAKADRKKDIWYRNLSE